jgi:hypothetical protein
MKYERAPEYEQQFTRLNTPYASEWPDRRPLKIFALDPLRGKTAGNEVTITIPNENLKRGPASERIKVIDYDGTLNVYYAPVDLDEGPILMRNGLDPSESDPRFHQQMVYAVTMRVLENFERALGRRLHFAREKQLRILPHAFRGANAFFDPSTNSVLFGYFAADAVDPGENLPGQTVFSCLSHDIVAHEVTHAIVHRLRRHYNEPTNLDVLAFHEAIADIVAIFQHFTIPEVLRNELQRQHGDLSRPGTLLELAKQFGHGTGRSEALRTALGPDEDSDGEKPKRPKADDYLKIREPHARGSLLVAAVFDAFFVAYQNRIRDVVRLATNGTGVLPTGDIPSDLVTILAAEAATAAQQTLAMCIRAFEFLPPVDVTFGDYLRALVTADRDLYPEDRFQMRSALIEAFRVRGIYPGDVDSLAEESLVWPTPKKPSATTANPEPKNPLPPLSRQVIGDLMAREVLGEDGEDEDDDAPPSAERAAAWTLTDYAKENAAELKLTPGPDPKISVHGFHPTFRIGSNGRVRVDVHAQFIQERPPKPGDEASYGGLRLYSGTTVVFGDDGAVRYLIAKPLSEEDAKKRGKRLRSLATIKEYIDALDDEDREMIWRDDVFLQRRMIERANFAALDRQGKAR